MRSLQQTQAAAPAQGQARANAPAQSQAQTTTQSGSNVPADLGEQISKAVNDALTAATQGVQSGENAAQARQQVRDAMEQLRRELQQQRADARPTVVQVPSTFPSDMIPPQAVTISIAFFAMLAFIIVGLPLARAWARRMDRKGQALPVPADISPRLDRIEQAVDAVAIEVERVSEGQRFTTKVLAELRSLPSPKPLEAWPAGREPAAVPAAPGERGGR